jgi:hypothetical protein
MLVDWVIAIVGVGSAIAFKLLDQKQNLRIHLRYLELLLAGGGKYPSSTKGFQKVTTNCR